MCRDKNIIQWHQDTVHVVTLSVQSDYNCLTFQQNLFWNYCQKCHFLLWCHGDADACSDSLMYLLQWSLSLASWVAWVSERPIIWQSSEMLSVQRFLGRPRCLFPWPQPYRAQCGHWGGCIRTTWPKYLRRRLRIRCKMSLLDVELILDVCIFDVRGSWHTKDFPETSHFECS